MSDELIPIKDSFIVVLDSRNATTYNNSNYLSDVLFIDKILFVSLIL